MFKKLEFIGWENESETDRHTVVRNTNETLKAAIVGMGDPKVISIGWPRK